MIHFDKLIYVEEFQQGKLEGLDFQYGKPENIVDYIIQITFDIWEKKGIGLIYDTYAKNIRLHAGLLTHRGIDTVISSTLDTLQVFPDRAPYGEEVIWCCEKVSERFFSSHRLGSTATHRGEHTVYGKPTGKKIFFRTFADCSITRNGLIDEEWLVRDNYYILRQLELDPVRLAQKSLRYSAGNQRTVQGYSIKNYNGDYSADNSCALILSLFREIFYRNYFNRLDAYYAETAVMYSICEARYSGLAELRDYFISLFASVPSADIMIDRITCNKGPTADKVAVRWCVRGRHKNSGLFGPPSEKIIQIIGISHFEMVQGKIQREWTVFDLFDVLCQIHAPDNTAAAVVPGKDFKKMFCGIMASNEEKSLHFSDDFVLNVSKPFAELRGLEECYRSFWQPLATAFPDLQDQPYIVMSGECRGQECLSVAGNLLGTFVQEWLGIPPTGQAVWLRYQAHNLLQGGKVVKAWYLLDILELMYQAGFSLLPQRAARGTVPAPMTGDGIIHYAVEQEQSETSLRLVSDMLAALCSYDGEDFASMGDLAKYWHERDMMWYGPAGIGTTRGLRGFQEKHQFPFLRAFPNRGMLPRGAQDHFATYAQGNYVCDFGFPSMCGTHSGDGWLGLDATGKSCTMRVMDFWRRDGNRLRENWVMIDMIDVLEQLGVDVFELLRRAREV